MCLWANVLYCGRVKHANCSITSHPNGGQLISELRFPTAYDVYGICRRRCQTREYPGDGGHSGAVLGAWVVDVDRNSRWKNGPLCAGEEGFQEGDREVIISCSCEGELRRWVSGQRGVRYLSSCGA